MDRRSFLGSTLGLFIGTRIPWIAAPVKNPVIEGGIILPTYRTAFRLDTGELIQGPGIKEIVDNKLVYAPIEMKRTLSIEKHLLYINNVCFSENEMCYINYQKGDTLRITNEFFLDHLPKMGEITTRYGGKTLETFDYDPKNKILTLIDSFQKTYQLPLKGFR